MTSDSNAIDSNTTGDTRRCPSCGGANNCAIAQSSEQNRGEQQCWCMVEPIGAPLPKTPTSSTIACTSCYCQRCLQKLSAEKKLLQ